MLLSSGEILTRLLSFSPVVYQAKIPITFHNLLSPTFQTCCFQGAGPRRPACFIMEQLIGLGSQVYRSSKSSYIYWCLQRCPCFSEVISRTFTPLSPLVQLPGTPPAVAECGFPLKWGSSSEQTGLTDRRNECKSQVVLSIEEIPQGTNRETMNFFSWTTSSPNLVLTLQKVNLKSKHWKICPRIMIV